jgi:hypothetical protein
MLVADGPRLEDGVHRLRRGHGQTVSGGPAHDEAVQGLQFHAGPATRSSCREEKPPGSAAFASARARSWAACGTGLPSASATAHTSATRRLNAAQAAGTVRISPIGSRAAAVLPACAQMKASLAHSTVLMLADSSAPNPACSQRASRLLARWLARPSSSPNVMLAGPPVCTITPGSAISAKMNAAARYIRSLKGKEVSAEELAGVVSRLKALLNQQPNNERIVQLLYLAIARARPSTVVTAGATLTATSVLSASADVVDAADALTVTKPEADQVEDVGRLVAKVARLGFRDLSFWQVLAVVLVVLLAVGLPFAQVKLPPEIQSLMTDEEATLGIGFAIAYAIMQDRKK